MPTLVGTDVTSGRSGWIFAPASRTLPPAVRPFPFDRLPRLSRDEARSATRWARSARLAHLRAQGRACAGWLGAPLELGPARPRDEAGLLFDAPLPSVVLDDGDGNVGMIVDPRVASAWVDRTLGGDGAVEPSAGPWGELERGVLAYAIARWLGDDRWRVRAVFAYPAAMREACGARPLVGLAMPIALGPSTGTLELWLPTELRPAPRPTSRPAWCGGLPVALAVTVGHATLAASELASVRPGDAILPDRLELGREDGALVGHARLAVVGGSWGMRAAVRGDKLRLERRSDEPVVGQGTREGSMSEDAADGLGDTPVTISIEVARLTLPLDEVASLTAGSVLSAGRPIGERVTLRAADRVIATGELVDVDGELAVRVLEISGA